MSKKVLYWSPHINQQVATVKAVRNSILSIKKFGNKKYNYLHGFIYRRIKTDNVPLSEILKYININ